MEYIDNCAIKQANCSTCVLDFGSWKYISVVGIDGKLIGRSSNKVSRPDSERKLMSKVRKARTRGINLGSSFLSPLYRQIGQCSVYSCLTRFFRVSCLAVFYSSIPSIAPTFLFFITQMQWKWAWKLAYWPGPGPVRETPLRKIPSQLVHMIESLMKDVWPQKSRYNGRQEYAYQTKLK